VGIPNAKQRASDYPHQFSGGMRQRAMIAMALVHNPDVLIADEPTTALDVTVQAQILALIDKVKRDFDIGVILITHDLGVVAETASTVMVMYAGRVREHGAAQEIFTAAQDPYTWGLLDSMPSVERTSSSKNIRSSVMTPSRTRRQARFSRSERTYVATAASPESAIACASSA